VLVQIFTILMPQLTCLFSRLNNENEVFINFALQESIFSATMLADEALVENILSTIEQGRRLEL
jgi:hypothetical protein